MKKIPTLVILSLISLSSQCQNTMLNENVIILGEKYFNSPISIEIKMEIGNSCSCQTFDGKDFKNPYVLLIEKANLDTLKDYSVLTIFNKDCFLYDWLHFPTFVRDYVIPYIDTTTVLFQRVNKTYPNWYIDTFHDRGGIIKRQTKTDHGTFYTREVSHHNFLIVLMNAKTYNEYLSHISIDLAYPGAKGTYYEGKCEENGIYYKVAIPILDN